MNVVKRAQDVCDVQIKALQMLSEAVNSDEYKRIIWSLMSIAADQDYTRRIIITGVGKNSNLATKASETFASLGIPSLYLNTCHYSHGDAGFIGPHDVVLHVSRSGTTAEMIFAAQHLRKIKPAVRQYLLHCSPDLVPDEAFDIAFCTGKAIEADTNNLAPTTSTTLLLSLLDTIAINLSDSINFGREDFLRYHPGGALGAMLRAEK